MTAHKPPNALTAWRHSPRFRATAKQALAKFRAKRHTLPKCGAKARTTGQPCKNLPLANGRCRCHGGLTPKGDGWHKPRLPDRREKDALAKFERKAKELERRKKERAARLAAMTPEQRERHGAWHRTHRPGAKAERHRGRQQRTTREWLSELLERKADQIEPEKDVFG